MIGGAQMEYVLKSKSNVKVTARLQAEARIHKSVSYFMHFRFSFKR